MKKVTNKFKIALAFIIGLAVTTTGVYAATTILSKDVSYDNTASGLSATNLQDAIDETYGKVKKKNCEGIAEKVGDRIKCGNDYFYIISINDSTVKMLTQYKVSPSTYRQSSSAACINFSVSDLSDSSSNLNAIIQNYVDYIKDTASLTSATGKLMSYSEATSLGCVSGSNYSCNGRYYWVAEPSGYWLGSAYNSAQVYYVNSLGDMLYHWPTATAASDGSCYYGIRIVVTVSKDELF